MPPLRCRDVSSPVEAGIPLATCCVVAINLVAAVYQFACLDDVATRRWTLDAYDVLVRGQLFRVATSTFLHGGALHLGMNMLSTVAIGASLERSVGSTRMASYVAWAVPLCGACSCLFALGCSAVTGDSRYARQPSLGFSGVLFALACSECARCPSATRSVFGLVEVPSRLYPWALLVAMQLIVSNASFLGHLGGLVVGSLEAGGFLEWLAPSAEVVAWTDSSRFTTVLRGFTASPADGGAVKRRESGLGDAAVLVRDLLVFIATLTGLDRIARRARASITGVCRRSAPAAAVVPSPSFPESVCV